MNLESELFEVVLEGFAETADPLKGDFSVIKRVQKKMSALELQKWSLEQGGLNISSRPMFICKSPRIYNQIIVGTASEMYVMDRTGNGLNYLWAISKHEQGFFHAVPYKSYIITFAPKGVSVIDLKGSIIFQSSEGSIVE